MTPAGAVRAVDSVREAGTPAGAGHCAVDGVKVGG
jgi:hypothetical protein